MDSDYDIAIVGGGVAGCAAALAASRENKKVVLIEKQCILGGLATSGLIAIYLPICDGVGHQVSFGIAEEFLKLSIELGCQRKYPSAWLENGSFEEKQNQRYEAQFNPNYFALKLEKILTDNNVTILYDALLTGVEVRDNEVNSIFIETVEGKKEIKVKSYVDASGDAKLCYLANEKTRKYQIGNIVAGWYYYVEDGKLALKKLGVVEKSNYLESYRHSEKPLTNSRFIPGGDYNDEVRFILQSHQQTLLDITKEKQEKPTFEVTAIPTMPEMRMTRCLDSKDTLTLNDNRVHHADSIGVVADWRRRGYIYEIPFSAMKCNLKNVFVCGRCINVDDEMWDVTRAIPCCAVTGEAAGIASSIYNKGEVSIDLLRDKLKEKGQVVHIDELNL